MPDLHLGRQYNIFTIKVWTIGVGTLKLERFSVLSKDFCYLSLDNYSQHKYSGYYLHFFDIFNYLFLRSQRNVKGN